VTPEQIAIVRLAISRAKCREDDRWSAGGLLAQIALLTGNTEDELKRWDAVTNGDGPLTLDRLQESGNGFTGWPLDTLVALDRVWRAGGDRGALERVAGIECTPTAEEVGAVAEPSYGGPERRSPFTVAIDLKSLLMLIALIGPLVAVITMVLQVRQDVRGNSIRATVLETRMQTMEGRMTEMERARVIYCAGRRAAASRDRSDSTTVRIPDAGC